MRIKHIAQMLGVATVMLVCCVVPLQSHADHHAEGSDIRASLQTLADGSHRSDDHTARNQYRHPVETLMWFGIQPDMTVVEIWPGGAGWYTEILAPFLKEHGKYYAAGPDAESESPYVQNSVKQFNEKLAAHPDLYSAVVVTELAPPRKVDIAPEGSADMVLTFRNVHNWMSRGYGEEVFKAMYRALKPGGILGLVEHRGNPDVPQDPRAASGYVTEEHTIKLAEAAGFQLVDRSEINANPQDTKDYPEGVWTLPPTLRLGEKERDTYLAIGESDRMTLKFMKPAE